MISKLRAVHRHCFSIYFSNLIIRVEESQRGAVTERIALAVGYADDVKYKSGLP
jgi:hypothetical protein